MASEVKVDKLAQKGSSGIVITDDIKLSSGKAIKNASGTALLGEDGALGSGVTGFPAGGITEADYWRLTTSFDGSEDPITSNLERCDTYGAPETGQLLGTGMTFDDGTGIFTFPSEGYWSITFNLEVSYAGDSRFNSAKILVSTNADSGATYNVHTITYTFIQITSSSTTYASASTSCLIDVTSTSAVKVCFAVGSIAGSATCIGNSATNRTSMQFLKLGDT